MHRRCAASPRDAQSYGELFRERSAGVHGRPQPVWRKNSGMACQRSITVYNHSYRNLVIWSYPEWMN